jgi:hypothetical protein
MTLRDLPDRLQRFTAARTRSRCWHRFGHPQDMETGGRPDCGVCAAVDVHYLSTGGAWAAAIVAADAAFAQVLAERTALVSRVPPYRPGEFYLRELPPLRAVLDGPARLGCARARRVRHPGDRSGQVPVPHRDPRGACPARILGASVVRHRGRDARSRRGGPGAAHGRPVPAARCTAPRRLARASRCDHSRRPPAWLAYAGRAERGRTRGFLEAGTRSWHAGAA